MDRATSQRVVVEQQHGLLCRLWVAEGDEAVALQPTRSTFPPHNSDRVAQ
jgi:hypothetical protein